MASSDIRSKVVPAASITAVSDTVVAQGQTAQDAADAANASLLQIQNAGSDAELHAQSTAPFTDSEGEDFDNGAKGYSQAAATSASAAAGSATAAAAAATAAEGSATAAAGSAADAVAAEAAAELARDDARAVVRDYGGREQLANVDAVMARPAPALTAVNAGAVWTNDGYGHGTLIGTPADFDWLGFRLKPNNAVTAMQGYWLAVRDASGGLTDPTLMPLVAAKFFELPNFRLPQTLGGYLGQWIAVSGRTLWGEVLLVGGKQAAAYRTAGTEGRTRYTAEGTPYALPARTDNVQGLEVYVGASVPPSRQTTRALPRLNTAGRRMLARTGYGAPRARVTDLERRVSLFSDDALVWDASEHGYVETFAVDDAGASLAGEGNMFTTVVGDLSTLDQGINAFRFAFQSLSTPPQRVRLVGLLTDHEASGGVLYDKEFDLDAEADAFGVYERMMDLLAEGQAFSVDPTLVNLIITDADVRFLGKAGFTGANTYVGQVSGAIDHPEPWRLLNETPTANSKGYLRIGRAYGSVPTAKPESGHRASGYEAAPRYVAASKRLAAKASAYWFKGDTVWPDYGEPLSWPSSGPSNYNPALRLPMEVRVFGIGASVVAQDDFWTPLKALLGAVFPFAAVGAGYWGAGTLDASGSTPKGNVTITRISGSGSSHDLVHATSPNDDGRARGIGSDVYRWYDDDEYEVVLGATGGVGVRAFEYVFDSIDGSTGVVQVEDVTPGIGEGVIGTVGHDAGVDGPALWRYVWEETAVRTLRLRCLSSSNGVDNVFDTRGLLWGGHLNRTAAEIVLGAFAWGGTEGQIWRDNLYKNAKYGARGLNQILLAEDADGGRITPPDMIYHALGFGTALYDESGGTGDLADVFTLFRDFGSYLRDATKAAWELTEDARAAASDAYFPFFAESAGAAFKQEPLSRRVGAAGLMSVERWTQASLQNLEWQNITPMDPLNIDALFDGTGDAGATGIHPSADWWRVILIDAFYNCFFPHLRPWLPDLTAV